MLEASEAPRNSIELGTMCSMAREDATLQGIPGFGLVADAQAISMTLKITEIECDLDGRGSDGSGDLYGFSCMLPF